MWEGEPGWGRGRNGLQLLDLPAEAGASGLLAGLTICRPERRCKVTIGNVAGWFCAPSTHTQVHECHGVGIQ